MVPWYKLFMVRGDFKQMASFPKLPDVRVLPTGPSVVGRIIPPPHWDTAPMYRAALAAGSCFRASDGHLVVQIRSSFVTHTGPHANSARDFSMRPQLLVRLQDSLRRVWRDRLFGREPITGRVVRPNPTDVDGTRRFHIFISSLK